MKTALRKALWPLLKPFEKRTGPYKYRPTNRRVLLAVGALFCLLALAVLVVVPSGSGVAALMPAVVFGGVGLVALVIGLLGSDRAVSSLWGNK